MKKHHITTIDATRHNLRDRSQFVFRPLLLEKIVTYFRNEFIGTVLFAVKANPEIDVIQHINQGGITCFDVSSLEEIKSLHACLPEAQLYFMHPVKSRYAIRQAYFEFGVRHFALDHEDELFKIMQETEHAKDLTLHVRLAVSNKFSMLPIHGKFGVDSGQAPALMRTVAQYAKQIGICFHVGSQCMNPKAYLIAIELAKDVLQRAKITPHFFNIGGGFPSIYPGMIPPDLKQYFEQINHALLSIQDYQSIHFLAEPGRALVAESMSLIVRVEQRKGNTLYINSGIYGGLFDAGTPGFTFPSRLIQTPKKTASLQAYQLYGPTCDSLDFMQGPFYLPEHIQEGDFIEIGQTGAYSQSLVSHFNGFHPNDALIHVRDQAILSMYE